MRNEYDTFFARVHNDHGEVIVAVQVQPITGRDYDLRLGFAFCNPKDRNKPRHLRNKIGIGIALKRLGGNAYTSNRHLEKPLSVEYLAEWLEDELVDILLHTSPVVDLQVVSANCKEFQKWFPKWKMSLHKHGNKQCSWIKPIDIDYYKDNR